MVYRDDLDKWEHPRSELTARVAGKWFKIKRQTRVVRDGSRCDYVYPAGEGCDAETSARDLGDPIREVNTATGNAVNEGVTFSVVKTHTKFVPDEFGTIHEHSPPAAPAISIRRWFMSRPMLEALRLPRLRIHARCARVCALTPVGRALIAMP